MKNDLHLWSDEGAEPRLVASRNRRTGEAHFPVFRSVSPLAAEHETIALSSRGEIYSYTIIHPNPKTGATPFAVGFVDLPEGVRVFGRIDAGADVRPRIGAVVRAVRDDEHGYVFQTLAAGGLR